MPTNPLQSHAAAVCLACAASFAVVATPLFLAAQPSPPQSQSPARAAETPATPGTGVKPAAAVELPAEVKAACQRIHADELIATIRFLASPRLEGRDAGERGAEVAADYLVSRFQAAGLRAGSKDGYLQRFDLIRRTLAPEEELILTRRTGNATASRPLVLRTDWVPLSFSEVGTVEAPVVFAGYGIVAPEYKWDDYAALGANGAKGKVVVVLRHEPDEEGKTGSKFFEGREMTLHASLRQKARVAAARGAVALLLVDDPLHHEVRANPTNSLGGWTFLTAEERKLPKDDPARPRGSASVDGLHEPLGVLAAHTSQELLRWLDAGRDWKALQRDLDAGRKSKAFGVPEATVRFVHAVEVERQPTSNVLAVLPGSDPVLAKEYVLVGGHYDHVGKDRRSLEIHHGADDNASGTAAVLAIAEAFASLSPAPARSLLFVGWGAEEKGLLGSAYFVRKPTVPLDKIVAGINLDMVGRNKEGEMSVVGRTETPDLTALFDRFAPEVSFALNDDAGAGASRSDNGSLWLGGIPTASLFSGTHEDYHRPGDTADKVLPGKVEKAARLAFLVSAEVASGRTTPAPLDVPAGPWKSIAPKRETKAVARPEARAAEASAAKSASAAAGEASGAGAKGTGASGWHRCGVRDSRDSGTGGRASGGQRAPAGQVEQREEGGRSMKSRFAPTTWGLALLVLTAVPLRAQAPEPRALLERAVAFHGGRTALQNLPHLKSSGTFEGGGRLTGRAMDAVYYERADGALRSEVAFEFRGRSGTAVTMFDDGMCKRRSRSTWDDIPADEYRERAAHRLPFLLQALSLDPVLAGEGEEAGTAVWRVEVPDGTRQGVALPRQRRWPPRGPRVSRHQGRGNGHEEGGAAQSRAPRLPERRRLAGTGGHRDVRGRRFRRTPALRAHRGHRGVGRRLAAASRSAAALHPGGGNGVLNSGSRLDTRGVGLDNAASLVPRGAPNPREVQVCVRRDSRCPSFSPCPASSPAPVPKTSEVGCGARSGV